MGRGGYAWTGGILANGDWKWPNSESTNVTWQSGQPDNTANNFTSGYLFRDDFTVIFNLISLFSFGWDITINFSFITFTWLASSATVCPLLSGVAVVIVAVIICICVSIETQMQMMTATMTTATPDNRGQTVALEANQVKVINEKLIVISQPKENSDIKLKITVKSSLKRYPLVKLFAVLSGWPDCHVTLVDSLLGHFQSPLASIPPVHA